MIYQTERLDKATEDRLRQFITNILPSVLEDKCGYHLFIHGRDDIPGEGQPLADLVIIFNLGLGRNQLQIYPFLFYLTQRSTGLIVT